MHLYDVVLTFTIIHILLSIHVNGEGESHTCEQANLLLKRYQSAERLLPWNAHPLTLNTNLQPEWLPDEDGNPGRFLRYRIKESPENEVVYTIDLATNKQVLKNYVNSTTVDSSLPLFLNESVSPDGRWAISIDQYNLYRRSLKKRLKRVYPLTSDGVKHCGYGGLPESAEQFMLSRRFNLPVKPVGIWSPNSKFFVTHLLDERDFHELHLLQTVPENKIRNNSSIEANPTKVFSYRYPMLGANTRSVELYIFDIENQQKTRIRLPNRLSALPEALLNSNNIQWHENSEQVYIVDKLNGSKLARFYLVDAYTGEAKILIEETSSTQVQVSSSSIPASTVRILSSTNEIIWYSDRDGYGHLYLYDSRVPDRIKRQLTVGKYIVRELVHIDQSQRLMYFTASGIEDSSKLSMSSGVYWPCMSNHKFDIGYKHDDLMSRISDFETERKDTNCFENTNSSKQRCDPYYRYLFVISMDDGNYMKLLTPEYSDHEINFSPDGSYFIDRYSRINTEPVTLLRSSFSGRVTNYLSKANFSLIDKRAWSNREEFSVLAADNLTDVYGVIYFPSDFNPNNTYPIIDDVYPSLSISRVLKSYPFDQYFIEDLWLPQSVAELGFIVITVDTRGTWRRNKQFRDYAHNPNLTDFGILDHIFAIRQLAVSRSYIDLDRVGIYGYSLGGYIATRALFKYPDFFKVAVTGGAPLDSIHNLGSDDTIRNVEVILDSDITRYVDNLRGKLLIMNGDMDDIANPLKVMRLINALIAANKDFDFVLFPNRDHASSYSDLYYVRKLWDYFVVHLLHLKPPTNFQIRILNAG